MRKTTVFAVLISVMLVLSFVSAVRADAVIATINLSQPAGVTTGALYDPKNGYVYVAYGYNETAVISGTSLIGNIAARTNIFVVDPSNGYLYGAVGTNPNYVLVVSDTKIIANLTVGPTEAGFPCNSQPEAAYDSFNGLVYVTSPACPAGTVTVINGTSVIGTVAAGDVFSKPAVDTSNGYVYVPLLTSPGEVAVISGTALLATLTVGVADHGITTITFNAFNGDVYVICDTSVWVLSGTSIVGTISPIRGGLVSPQVVPSNGDLYIATQPSSTSGPDYIVLISGTSVVGNITVGNSPLIAFDAKNGYLYDSSAFNGTGVSVISGTKIIANITTSKYPWFPVVDPANGNVYVTTSQPPGGIPDPIWVISGTSLLGIVTAGVHPENPLYDPSNGYLYVPNQGGVFPVIGSVSVISTSAPFTSTTVSSSSTATAPSSATTSTATQSPTTQSSTSSSTSGGGGVPEFPYQFVIATVFTFLLAATYLFVRRRTAPG